MSYVCFLSSAILTSFPAKPISASRFAQQLWGHPLACILNPASSSILRSKSPSRWFRTFLVISFAWGLWVFPQKSDEQPMLFHLGLEPSSGRPMFTSFFKRVSVSFTFGRMMFCVGVSLSSLLPCFSAISAIWSISLVFILPPTRGMST